MIRNLLSPQTAGTSIERKPSLGTWASIQNATISYSSKRSKVGDASFLVTHTGSIGSTAIIASGSTGTRVPITEGTVYRAALWFHHNRRLRPIQIGIEFFDVANASVAHINRTVGMTCAITANVRLDDWTLGIVEATAPVNAYSAAVRIEIPDLTSEADDQLLWIDSISLVAYEEPSATTVKRVLAFMPEYMDEQDRKQTSPTRPLARFAELLGIQLEEVRLLNFAFDYRSLADGGEIDDTSILVDPSGYPDSGVKQEWLPWIGQHFGVSVVETQGGTTPWFFLEEQYPTWSEWETEINEAASDPPLTIINSERSVGIAEIQTSTAHSLTVGDVVTVATSPSSEFDGIYSVYSIPAADTFTYSQQYRILSGYRTAGNQEVTIIGSRPHGLSIGASVSVAGTGNSSIEGTQVVTDVFQAYDDGGYNGLTYNTVPTTQASVFAGVFYPIDSASSATSGSATLSSDLTWSFIEGDNPYPAANDLIASQLISSGATGLWAGTIEGIKRATRTTIGASGIVDLKAILSCRDGVMTVSCRESHSMSVSDFVEIYKSPEPSLNGVYSVASVISDNEFTVLCRPGNFVVAGWITSKKVEVEKGKWNGLISSVVVLSGTMTIQLRERLPVDSITGNATISGTGNTFLDAAHSGPISVSSDRYTLTLTTGLGDLTALLLPATSKVLVNGGSFCFLIKTFSAQTLSVDQTISIALKAKPVGSVITHQFI